MIEKIFIFLIIALVVLVVLILVLQLLKQVWIFVSGGLYIGAQQAENAGAFIRRDTAPKVLNTKGEPEVRIARGKWKVEIADDLWERAKGLSGRESLPENEGMVFLFDKPKIHKFWMKGMKFSLDFVWIKGDRVVDISENAPPLTLTKPTYYFPSEPADMVLEINVGEVQKWGIKKGDIVKVLNF